MNYGQFFLQPTVRALLSLEALSESHVAWGEDLLEKRVIQVVYGLMPPPRPNSLVIARAEQLLEVPAEQLNGLAGVILIKPEVKVLTSSGSSAHQAVAVDLKLEPCIEKCTEAEVALITIPAMGDAQQMSEDIRLAFLAEIKRLSLELHTHFISLVLAEGLETFVQTLSAELARPIAVETADFKVLAAENMSSTPVSQQRTLTEEVTAEMKRQKRAENNLASAMMEKIFRAGRRLVVPIVLEEALVGYLSAMVRPTDDTQMISEYLRAAALAVMVDFNHQSKQASVFAVTQKSLLKDLLLGRTLSASDQERVEQHFGFDIAEGLLVAAIRVLPPSLAKEVKWPEESYAVVEVEGNRFFVLPHDPKRAKGWKADVDSLIAAIRGGRNDFRIQAGIARVASNSLDLSDSYREARQALVVGSMIHGEEEFCIDYGVLGIKRLLYLMIDHPELDRFYEENLAPLEAYDIEWESDLLVTLRVYLKHGANLNSAAKELFIHRHTMRYRLEQIAELLKVDIDSAEVLLNLQIAFQIREMKGKSKN